MAEPRGLSRWSREPGSRVARSALAALLVCAAALLALPSGASALKLTPCKVDASFGCGSVRVPLDHRGRTPGTISLAVAAQREYPKDAGLLIALSGGPGQNSVDAMSSFAISLEPMLRRYRLVVVDQRGTGLSGALDCPELQRVKGLDEFSQRAVERCAKRIGPRRAFYRTADSVDDLEALRRAFGAKKVALMGISYGTWVAQEYARSYPRQTDSLVLDSVVGPEPTDAFAIDGYRQLPRVFRELCRRGRCKSATSDFPGDVNRLAETLGRGPLSGTVYDHRGRGQKVSYTAQHQFFFLVTSGDLNPFMQARMPGAVYAANRGDLAPLLRLKRMGDGPPSKLREFSWALSVATGCLDASMPFSFAQSRAERLARSEAALAAVPPASYAPWTTKTVRDTSYADDCMLWPTDTRPPLPRRPLPDVRTLLLAGRLDMRTPVEDALRVRALLPRGEIVTVPGNGHDQVDSDQTGCVARALERFTARRKVGNPCKGTTNLLPPIPRAPRGLAEIEPPKRVAGDRGRVLLAAVRAVEDARFTGLEALFSGFMPRGGGLRGGSFSASDAFDGRLTLRSYSYVPGVRVSGRLRIDGNDVRGRVRVAGRMSGVLDLRSTRSVRGMLGGRRVAWTLPHATISSGDRSQSGAFPRIPAALLDRAAFERRARPR
jgi:pimeloyl-ACP methyl ester carboxylesterase